MPGECWMLCLEPLRAPSGASAFLLAGLRETGKAQGAALVRAHPFHVLSWACFWLVASTYLGSQLPLKVFP